MSLTMNMHGYDQLTEGILLFVCAALFGNIGYSLWTGVAMAWIMTVNKQKQPRAFTITLVIQAVMALACLGFLIAIALGITH